MNVHSSPSAPAAASRESAPVGRAPSPRASAAEHILFIDEPVPVPFRDALRRRYDALLHAGRPSLAPAADRPEIAREN